MSSFCTYSISIYLYLSLSFLVAEDTAISFSISLFPILLLFRLLTGYQTTPSIPSNPVHSLCLSLFTLLSLSLASLSPLPLPRFSLHPLPLPLPLPPPPATNRNTSFLFSTAKFFFDHLAVRKGVCGRYTILLTCIVYTCPRTREG